MQFSHFVSLRYLIAQYVESKALKVCEDFMCAFSSCFERFRAMRRVAPFEAMRLILLISQIDFHSPEEAGSQKVENCWDKNHRFLLINGTQNLSGFSESCMEVVR